MFGKTRTSAKGRIIAGLLAALMLAVCALTACQPVSGETIHQVPAAEYKVTGHWNETVNDGKLVINIDTDILEPKVSEYPVVKVEPLIFSQERVDELVNYFAKGRKLYRPQKMTKSEYQKEIEAWLTPRWIGGRLVVSADNESHASQLEKEMANAPESYPKVYIGSTLTCDIDNDTKAEKPESGKNFINAMVEDEYGNDPVITLGNYTEGYADWTFFDYNTPQSYKYISETAYKRMLYWLEMDGNPSADDERRNQRVDELAGLFEKVTLSEKDARVQAEKAISDLGIGDLILVNASRAVSLDYPDKGGWWFGYARQNGGIPANVEGTVVYNEDYPLYLNTSPERLSVIITENGIERFIWADCAKEIETVSENEKLLPLGEIKQALKKRIADCKISVEPDRKGYKLASGDIIGYGMKNFKVTVNSARLCMCYTGTKNEDNSLALVVPVWAFETEISYYDTERKQTVGNLDDTYIFDARDGTAIEGTIIL